MGGAKLGTGANCEILLAGGGWKFSLTPPFGGPLSLAEKEVTMVVSYPRFCPLGPRKFGFTSLLEAGDDGAEPPCRFACFFQYS